MRNALLKLSVHSNTADYPSYGQVAHGARMHFEDPERLMSDFEEIGRRINQPWRRNVSTGLEVVMKRLAKLGLGSSEKMRAVAAAHLARLPSTEGFLSSDHSHARLLDDTLGRLGEFRNDLKRGEFA